MSHHDNSLSPLRFKQVFKHELLRLSINVGSRLIKEQDFGLRIQHGLSDAKKLDLATG